MVTNRNRKSFESRWQKKVPNVVQTTGTVDDLIHVQTFRDPLRGELPHVQIFMNDGHNPLTLDVRLLSY